MWYLIAGAILIGAIWIMVNRFRKSSCRCGCDACKRHGSCNIKNKGDFNEKN
ncbi:MAG: FeoB-associated Cys-rich membrane protein [Clostridia bacterium]|nr:FeoB-associated Cys-rich membrane protein [Clostridia bacterium]